MPSNDRVTRLFSEYTRMRHDGRSREQSWYGIQAFARTFDKMEQSRLRTFIREWEAREGQHYQPRGSRDPHETLNKPPGGLAHAQSPGLLSRSSLIRRIEPRTDPIQVRPGEPVICSRCGRPNRQGEAHCLHCGEPLGSEGGTQPMRPVDSAGGYFGEHSVLYLEVRGYEQMIRLEPRQVELVIGRMSPDNVMIPDVDLTPYGGDVSGVSRLHASIRRQDDTLVLTDMGSRNHTYINNQRVFPHEVRVLNHGDVIQFGHLQMRVHFQHQ
jgi:hypothetical protein